MAKISTSVTLSPEAHAFGVALAQASGTSLSGLVQHLLEHAGREFLAGRVLEGVTEANGQGVPALRADPALLLRHPDHPTTRTLRALARHLEPDPAPAAAESGGTL